MTMTAGDRDPTAVLVRQAHRPVRGRSRVEQLGTAECLRLIAGKSLGRVAYTERALPSIRPIHYALVGTHLLLRPWQEGLAARLDRQVVAVEIDDADDALESGWVVVVTGTARILHQPNDLIQVTGSAGAPMAGPQEGDVVSIRPGDIQGYRILSGPSATLNDRYGTITPPAAGPATPSASPGRGWNG